LNYSIVYNLVIEKSLVEKFTCLTADKVEIL